MFVKNGGRLVDCTVVCTAANGIAWLLLWGRLLFTQLFRYAAVTAVVLLKHSDLPTWQCLHQSGPESVRDRGLRIALSRSVRSDCSLLSAWAFSVIHAATSSTDILLVVMIGSVCIRFSPNLR